MHFICSIAAFKARNSYFQSKPFGNCSKSCKIIREQHFCTFDDSCAWLYDKKKNYENLVYVTPKNAGKSVCNVLHAVSG